MADNFKPVQAQVFTLSGSGISSSDTSIILSSFKLPDGTTNITMTDFGTIGYGVLEQGTTREETVSFTGVTQNGNGTATLTGVTRGIRFVDPYDSVGANKFSHSGGTSFVLSNPAVFYSKFTNKENDETINGTWTFTTIPELPASDPTTDNQAARKAYVDTKLALAGGTMTGLLTLSGAPTLDLHAATKKYVDDTAFAGAPDASTTQKGVVEEATQAEIIAGTGAGGTGARLFVNPTAVAETGADKVIKTKSTGLLDPSIIPPIFAFGDGSDGAVNLDGTNTFSFLSKSGNTYTATRDFYATNLTIGSGVTLVMNGYLPFVSDTVSGSGTLRWNTANAGGNASGTTAGTGGAANSSGGRFYQNAAGGNGTNDTSNGNNGSSVTTAIGVSGGSGGGNGGTGGGGGGSVTAPTTKFGVFADLVFKGIDFNPTTPGYGAIYRPSGGGGGGKGGFNSGAGGGGGASGGIIALFAKTWSGTFTIESRGANGGNASTTANGGGGGGGGGVSVVVYATKTWTGSYSLAGGSAGTSTSGASGSNAGTTGVSYEILITSLTR